MNFNGQIIDASARGFRGGFSYRNGGSPGDNYTYLATSDDTLNGIGKGEGIAGSPKNMWDGFIQVINDQEGLLDEEQQLTEEEVVDIMQEQEGEMEDMVEAQGLVVVLEAVQGLLPTWEFLFPPD